jgi:hypothetical protein
MINYLVLKIYIYTFIKRFQAGKYKQSWLLPLELFSFLPDPNPCMSITTQSSTIHSYTVEFHSHRTISIDRDRTSGVLRHLLLDSTMQCGTQRLTPITHPCTDNAPNAYLYIYSRHPLSYRHLRWIL